MAPATTVQAVIMVASTVMILMAVMALTMIQLSWNVLPMILRAVTTLMPGLKLLVSWQHFWYIDIAFDTTLRTLRRKDFAET